MSLSADQTEAELRSELEVNLKYLIALPEDYASQEKWPLVLFLHGKGERGDNLELVKKHGPPKLAAEGKKFPFILVSPQCPIDRWWQPQDLTALLDHICQEHNVDADRVYVTGLSMGGFGTWSLVHFTPDRFAAIAPICGGGFPIWVQDFAHVPAWVFHGEKDTVVPVEYSRQMVESLEKANADVRLTVYPEASHDSWTETYANPKLYEWLLSHRRQPSKPAE